MAKKKTGIVGKWFLALNQEGKLDLQGRVLERMKERICLTETYGWGDCEVYDERIISVDKMCNWRFYPDLMDSCCSNRPRTIKSRPPSA